MSVRRRANQIIANRIRAIAGKVSRLLQTAEPTYADQEDRPRDRPTSRDDAERTFALRVLELDTGAGPEEIRSAYLRMCREFHPDRYRNDPERELLANRLLIEIIAAYDRLRMKT